MKKIFWVLKPEFNHANSILNIKYAWKITFCLGTSLLKEV